MSHHCQGVLSKFDAPPRVTRINDTYRLNGRFGAETVVSRIELCSYCCYLHEATLLGPCKYYLPVDNALE